MFDSFESEQTERRDLILRVAHVEFPELAAEAESKFLESSHEKLADVTARSLEKLQSAVQCQ